MTSVYTVRRALWQDAPALLALMRELARFEGYLDQFRVSENDLLERGLGEGSTRQRPRFPVLPEVTASAKGLAEFAIRIEWNCSMAACGLKSAGTTKGIFTEQSMM